MSSSSEEIRSIRKKRPRAGAEQQQPSSSIDEQPRDSGSSSPLVVVTLTAHTHRLLRLVKEGTTDHAKLAARHLTSIAAQSSPLVLWDLLGRLVETLSSPSWSCRYNASMAMEGIARHLPPSDQYNFLTSKHKQNDGEGDDGLWLNIEELGQSKEQGNKAGLDDILDNGRLLLASTGEEYDSEKDALYQQEHGQLQRLDASAGTRQDFLRQRVRLQRHILAQRLGFGGVLQSVTDDDHLLSDTITNDDLLDNSGTEQPASSRRLQHMERIRKKKRKSDPEAASSSSSVRALLVMEMDQQRKTSSCTATSHGNPQTLLATELIYQMFSPFWHVRHGALLGALALFRAWSCSDQNTDNCFGVWPNDLLARCLCVLALDRFGDYSGSFVESSSDSSNSSGGVVAPVREVAGQLLSVILTMAPLDVQKSTCDILLYMAQHSDEWEVRHGALLAIKYIVAVNISTEKDEVKSQMVGLIVSATEILDDDSDDVQSVAAQVLACCFRGSNHSWFDLNGVVHSCSRPLWTALSAVKGVASSSVDLVELFSRFVCHNCTLVLTCLASEDSDSGKHVKLDTMNRLLGKLLDVLQFDSLQVKLSILEAIQVIAEPVSAVLLQSREDESSTDCEATYFSLVENVFESHFDASFSPLTAENEEERRQSEFLVLARDRAWRKLVDNSHSLFELGDDHVKALLLSVTLRYFGIQLPKPVSGTDDSDSMQCELGFQRVDPVVDASDLFATRINTSKSLAYLLSKLLPCDSETTGELSKINEFVETTIISLLKSPWMSICEAACLLHKALCTNTEKASSQPSVLVMCQSVLGNMLHGVPPCVVAESKDTTKAALSNDRIVDICDRALVASLSGCLEKQGDGAEACRLISLWQRMVGLTSVDEGGSIPVSVGSVRVNATIAGAMLPLGRKQLPAKLTPLIRSLMTSLKSEASSLRQRETCADLVNLLTLLSPPHIDKKSKADSRIRDKILENICALSYAGSAKESLASREAATRVIEMLVNRLDADVTLEALPSVWARLGVLNDSDWDTASELVLDESLSMMNTVSKSLQKKTKACFYLIQFSMPSLVSIACSCSFPNSRVLAVSAVESLCSSSPLVALERGLPCIVKYLRDMENDASRLGGCNLLQAVIDAVGMEICPFVRCLLPTVMSLMTDPLQDCSRLSSQSFAALVRVAPIVRNETSKSLDGISSDENADKVVDHLIHGKPLPPCVLPHAISEELKQSNTTLRNYQAEGVAWIRFLQTVNLCGALCDDMGCGKTLQALIGIAMSHCQAPEGEKPTSLVVCPSSVVGHWVAEIRRFFPMEKVFQVLPLIGNAKRRKALWAKEISKRSIVVTSYSFLRSDIAQLSSKSWNYCVLDEGHLLKNPKTATAIASRRIRSRHRLILTGTPVQNRVNELWAAFDFLMPNFLGSAASFSKEYAKPITMGHLPDASAESISFAMDKLKTLHQQVLPFILRREKADVLKELPPKTITDIPCSLSAEQEELYKAFCVAPQGGKSLEELQRAVLGAVRDVEGSNEGETPLPVGSDVLKSLLYLRLLCTHPVLVNRRRGVSGIVDEEGTAGPYAHLESSGKLLALNELLRSAGICGDELTAADNDTSLLYCDTEGSGDDSSAGLGTMEWGDTQYETPLNETGSQKSESKCLIFAQFNQSLDVVESLLFEPHMPSLRYLRMDGQVPLEKRADIVDRFNNDDSIKAMMLTTKVGGLGLNLSGADTVIFLEHDWNPHVDLQAMDRAHRLGQTKSVNVYRLVTSNTIEEQIMRLQGQKLAVSNAIVNTDNSTMFSMGTDRLLDIFSFRGDGGKQEKANGGAANHDLDALDEEYSAEDYASLSVQEFLRGFQQTKPDNQGN